MNNLRLAAIAGTLFGACIFSLIIASALQGKSSPDVYSLQQQLLQQQARLNEIEEEFRRQQERFEFAFQTYTTHRLEDAGIDIEAMTREMEIENAQN